MMGLPEGYTTRAPNREDAETVAALIYASELADNGASDMSLDELLDDWHSLDPTEEAVAVVAPDGTIAAYADVFNRSYVTVSVFGYVHPDFRSLGLGTYLVAWGERWTRERMPNAPENARIVAQHYINRSNEAAQRLLESHGYAQVRGVYVMETVLDEAPPQPHWPEGILVRTFVLKQDERSLFEAVEDAFRDMWGRPRGTFERFVRETEMESFDPSLWFLATEGDEIAGATLCKTLAGEGWVDRRRGAAPVAKARARARPPSPRLYRIPPARRPQGRPQRGRREHHRRPQALRKGRHARQGELRHLPQRASPGRRPRRKVLERTPVGAVREPPSPRGSRYQTNV